MPIDKKAAYLAFLNDPDQPARQAELRTFFGPRADHFLKSYQQIRGAAVPSGLSAEYCCPQAAPTGPTGTKKTKSATHQRRISIDYSDCHPNSPGGSLRIRSRFHLIRVRR